MKKKKLLSIVLVLSMILTLAGCSKKGTDSEYIPNIGNTSGDNTNEQGKNTGGTQQTLGTSDVTTIAAIKTKYGTLDKVEIKPFYNVDQRTQFTFHFNAVDLEPSHAVTVHTDSKCEVNSMVYQISDGYLVNNGLDVVVKPGSPALQSNDDTNRYTWGKAPVYYLSINYDMDATTPTKLETPIIVPFTVKADVSTPNLTASVSTIGKFELQWKPVAGAIKYNIYEANEARESAGAQSYTRAECGYSGDHLRLVDTVDGNTYSYDGFSVSQGSTIEDGEGHISTQNFFVPSTYYVSAVDAAGNESQYSMAVTSWKFESQIPQSFDRFTGFELNSSLHVVKLPSEVQVKMMDGSYASFPINFRKVSENYGLAEYEYEILGTILTGKITYESEDGNYPDVVNSSSSVNYGLYQITNDINIVPDISLSTINDDSYSNSVINIDKQVEYPESSKLVYSRDALLIRADVENVRMINDGVYKSGYTPLDIDTYKESGQSATPYIKDNSSEQPQSTEGPAPEIEETPEEEAPTEIPNETSTEITNETPAEIPDEITSENLVQEQIDSTKREVEEANQNEVPTADVVYFAESAEEEYLALMMIARQEYFDISAFPSLQNSEYLVDVLMKVIYQNPYIISPKQFGYAPEEKILAVEYGFSPEETFKRQVEISEETSRIISSIITPGMSDEDKVNAIWEYLEDNTKYDDAALEAAEAANFQGDIGHEDAFNAYGIMCKKVGVCQSYSYCYKLLLNEADVPCVTLTGFLDKTLPHAWNAVQLSGGNWYWLDATNNKNVTGIPYFLYQTSSTSAIQADYLLDSDYALDTQLSFVMTEDNTKDWWYKQGLCVESAIDLGTAFSKSYQLGSTDIQGMKAIIVKNTGNISELDLTEDALRMMVQSLYSAGMSEEELQRCQMFMYGKYIILGY